VQLTEQNTFNFSPSCERNKQLINEQLINVFKCSTNLLEIGSLSGQHAAYISPNLPNLTWQPSDLVENIAALRQNLQLANIGNIKPAISLDVCNKAMWPNVQFDAIFTANTLHIMPWQAVIELFENLQHSLAATATLCIYGPFKYNGEFTSHTNADFELWLKEHNSLSGIRDFEAVNQLANNLGFKLLADIAMPANNQLLIWSR
jgi:hypothetical protein